MKAIVTSAGQGIDSVRLAEVPVPQPRAGEARVRIEAAGVNPADWKVVLRGMPGWSDPQVLGLDGVGTVESLGAGTAGLQVGERVWFHHGLTRLGAYADYVCAEAGLLSRAPEGLAPERAAAVPTPGFTAWQIVGERLRMDGVRSAVVLGGSGALAAFLLQALARRGITVLATASAGREDIARSHGARQVVAIDRVQEAVAGLPGRSADVVIDATGNPGSAKVALSLCGYGAQLVLCTGWGVLPPPDAWPRGITVHDVFLGGAADHPEAAVRARLGAIGAQLAQAIERESLQVPTAAVVAPRQVPLLLAALAAGREAGKFVVDWKL